MKTSFAAGPARVISGARGIVPGAPVLAALVLAACGSSSHITTNSVTTTASTPSTSVSTTPAKPAPAAGALHLLALTTSKANDGWHAKATNGSLQRFAVANGVLTLVASHNPASARGIAEAISPGIKVKGGTAYDLYAVVKLPPPSSAAEVIWRVTWELPNGQRPEVEGPKVRLHINTPGTLQAKLTAPAGAIAAHLVIGAIYSGNEHIRMVLTPVDWGRVVKPA